MDVLLLSRLQFAFTIMFHYLFPPLTIGLGVMLVILEGLYLKTRDPQYEAAARFWTRIFAINFAVGVTTGIVMEFQFGTNWAAYSRYVGDVFGSALAAEGIFAFFLESCFLAVLVFGWDRVSPRMHFFSTVMVALGSIFSSIWIIVANSWQQTPAGHHIVERLVNGQLQKRAEITDFWAVVFNPSTMHRLVHVWLGAFILGAFFVMSVTAYYILKKRHEDISRKTFKAALIVAAVSSLGILVSGHLQANNVYRHQPAKLAAFEGHFHTAGNAPLHLFGVPDEQEQRVKYSVSIPGGLSFLIHGKTSDPVKGLAEWPRSDWPPVGLSFQTYHLMILLGMAFITLTLFALLMLAIGRLFRMRWLLWVFVFAVAGPYVSNEAGWVAAEVGRQPWIVYGLLKTCDGLSPTVKAEHVLGSIITFGLIYALLFAVFIYVLHQKIRQGPIPVEEARRAERKGLHKAARELIGRDGASLTDAHPDDRAGGRDGK
ncbi:MAG TPA: cytochrome ubiquinol oxidase subunit I [Phycisphaerae bacterium]|nr:cytochrome ubiquinol oxidase subunit I [Phycisphaerae bacterium]